jgi:hypothetical protein
VAEVKGVAADAVADYLRSADVYQVHTLSLHPGARLCACARAASARRRSCSFCNARLDGVAVSRGQSVCGVRACTASR